MRKVILSSMMLAAISVFIQDTGAWGKKNQSEIITFLNDSSAALNTQNKVNQEFIKFLAGVFKVLEKSNATATECGKVQDQSDKQIAKLRPMLGDIKSRVKHGNTAAILRVTQERLSQIATENKGMPKGNAAKNINRSIDNNFRAILDQYVRDAQRPALTYESNNVEIVDTPGVKVEVVDENKAIEENSGTSSTSTENSAVPPPPPPPALSADEAYKRSFGKEPASGAQSSSEEGNSASSSEPDGLVVPPPPPAPPAPPPPPPAPAPTGNRLLNGKTKADLSAAEQPAVQTTSGRGFTAADLRNVKLRKVNSESAEPTTSGRGFTATDLQNVKLRKVSTTTSAVPENPTHLDLIKAGNFKLRKAPTPEEWKKMKEEEDRANGGSKAGNANSSILTQEEILREMAKRRAQIADDDEEDEVKKDDDDEEW